jgi:hypothetical protein
MNVLTRRAFTIAAIVAIALTAAACGDNEPEQRKAFIAFLQTRIVDKPGVHVPTLTAAETSSFGPYAAHFNVIRGFTENPEMNALSEPLQKLTQGVSLNSIQGLVDNRAVLRTVKDDIGRLMVAMNRALSNTMKEREALKQPDDLKAVYDKAFEKDVLAPARGFNEAVPLVVDIADAALKVADYIDANRSKITIQGRQAGGNDPKTARELDILVKNLSSQGPKFQDAQRRLRAAITGS